jgi:hypothetical protein
MVPDRSTSKSGGACDSVQVLQAWSLEVYVLTASLAGLMITTCAYRAAVCRKTRHAMLRHEEILDRFELATVSFWKSLGICSELISVTW